MSSTTPHYDALTAHLARLDHLEGATGMLHWDAACMMPKGGAGERSEQLAVLRVLAHQLATDARVADWLKGAEGEALDDRQAANLREAKRQHAHATAVPEDLVAALSRAGSDCEMTWREARAANDFKMLAPKLTKVLDLVREQAKVKSAALGVSTYDALLDPYEPGGSEARIDVLFDDLAAFLPDFTAAVIDRQASKPAPTQPAGPFSIEAQRALGLKVMATLGFDFDHGRLDISHHPFCGGTATDVRITTRYDEADFTRSLMGVIHETGHALYEMGLPRDLLGQPVAKARGMSVHESQSLLMEMQACRSRQFIEHVSPLLQASFAPTAAHADHTALAPENLYRLYTRVRRSFIRVDADEVTYPAHVILRYRLEKALLSGDLQVAELPGAWREGMLGLLGVAPDTDRDGCMQDIHWMDGSVGYFPTYTLGAMTAAQLFDAACKADADVLPGIARGDFKPLLGWLRPNVHSQGSRYSTDDLLTRATGRPLDAAVFKAHLKARYLPA